MDENIFWFRLWATVGIVLAFFIATVGICNAYSDLKISEMVASGADPISARCAIYGAGERNNALCVINQIKKEK